MSTDGIFWSRDLGLSVILLLRTKFRVNQDKKSLRCSRKRLSIWRSAILNLQNFGTLSCNSPWKHNLSRTVSEINGDFSRKSQNFLTPVYFFALPLKGFPLELSTGAEINEWWGYWAEKKFDDIFSRVNTIHHREGQTPDDSKDRAYAQRCAAKKSRGQQICTHNKQLYTVQEYRKTTL